MNTFLPNKRIPIMIVFLLLILVLLTILAFRSNRGASTLPPTPTPADLTRDFPVDDTQTIQEKSVVRYSPTENSILTPGQPQEFVIEFSSPINTNDTLVFLKTKEFTSADYQKVEISQILDQNNRLLRIRTVPPILSSQSYNLAIYQGNGSKLLQVTYLSERTERTVESRNYPILAQHLPHQTDSYSLVYIPERNLYVFSFVYNENSSDPIELQYDKAREQAATFIESKGIDINSVVIEWRYH